jgi:hypothetical protein
LIGYYDGGIERKGPEGDGDKVMKAASVKFLFLVVAVILFGIAIDFGNRQAFMEVHAASGGAVAVTSNLTAGIASAGFALAGSIALVAAALVRKELA